ncbi:gluconokinase [Flagellimonas olearia]|uniref:Gluconokinase n=1 Tax=Flagellimonas olearia TaxID=552546 RepID=A0A444VQD1_9FLAO|nr:gluconokinase [Allomuricauda olearia]RYC52889.1 gluconate kinase [Allomuricauda olearia]
MTKTKVLVVMGVSGTGKTTVGKLLSEQLGYPFFDGDDFHPEENINKMASGKPLNDDDRKGWLLKLNQLALQQHNVGAVITCSALKKAYRSLLRAGMGSDMQFIYLNGSFDLVKSRLENRKDHFMPIALLKTQFEALEPPSKAIAVSIAQQPDQIVQEVLKQLK